MKKLIVAMVVVLALTLATIAPAFAHVHGITPLNKLIACGKANANAGGLATDGTPAAVDNGGPIKDLIPRDVGNAPLTRGDGGFGATKFDCPPL